MHQMGTCRMGASPNTSVADGRGQCWDVAGLYIADASCFPTSSGEALPAMSNTSSTVQCSTVQSPDTNTSIAVANRAKFVEFACVALKFTH